MSDALLDALREEQASDQPAKPQYVVGSSTDGSKRFLAVDRVATRDGQPGMEFARMPLSGERRFMVTVPSDLVSWVVAMLGAYLTDEEWEDAAGQREDEIERRAWEATL